MLPFLRTDVKVAAYAENAIVESNHGLDEHFRVSNAMMEIAVTEETEVDQEQVSLTDLEAIFVHLPFAHFSFTIYHQILQNYNYNIMQEQG